ncbi:phage protein F-like protein [[Clostridium] asparagiforme DSM 15981]|uniref:Phage protein F-like protein n=1 Tax=[Clostridium] asparagiforme DSM 15981 TaxID=518636 RepID=C0DAI9_9FIRM|nr:phage protein F-like protein [[Clostridium] asparagiforme DSM 15981]DAX18095.1 MAG TPA: minor capsid protein [Caudoviricetes sp.]
MEWLKNSEYWKLRFEQLEQAQNGQGAAAFAEIERQYKEAQKQIEGQIARWYQRFADNNGITLAQARQYLKGAALKEFQWDVQDYIKYGQDNALMGGWMKELENASAKYHISKLEALKIQTQQSLEVMFSKQMGTVTGAMGDIFESGYYHTAYELQKGFNIGWDIAGLDQSQIEKVLSKPWAVDGKNFSERIWTNKEKLISELHGELTQNIMLGADPQKAIDSLAKKMNTSKQNAGRLIMTEEAYFSSAAQRDCFNDLDVEQYEIVATLDSHTSDICRSLDGKHFPMKDFQAGVTAPPFHVYCRSTTVPYFDEDFGDIGERAARDEETGKTYYIPDDMHYEDWKQTFVDGGDKSGFDVVDDGSALHYSHHKEPEPALPPKKEYLTKKKLQAKIADADVQLEDLNVQFMAISGGWSYDEAIKDFGSLEGLTDGEDLTKLKDLHSQMEAIEAQKAEWQEKLNEKLKAEQKKALAKKQLELEAQKAAVQQQLDDFEIKTYSGIWYNKDVTTADWESLNIAGKKQYYEGKFITETDPDLMKKYQDLYKQLEELDTEGKSYHDIQQQLKKIEQEISKVQADLKKVENSGIIEAVDDAYSQARKDAAMWAKSTKEADALLRDRCGEVWRSSPPIQKNAIYDYTQSYHKFNEPLRGIEYGSEKFLGVGNVDLDQIGVSYSGWKPGAMRKEINAMTDIIEKSVYQEDFWLQRGCRFKGMDKFFNVPMDKLQHASQAELEALLLGTTPTEYGFCSCGVAKGKGFSGDIILNIYAPSGTQMMYVEPFSAFGNGSGKSWDGLKPQSSFGQESEIILQQGTTFRVTKVEKTPGTIYIDLEVIGQKPQR